MQTTQIVSTLYRAFAPALVRLRMAGVCPGTHGDPDRKIAHRSTSAGFRCGRRVLGSALGGLIALCGFLPVPAAGEETLADLWPQATTTVRNPHAEDGDIVRAARSDLRRRGMQGPDSSLDFARWLVAVSSEAEPSLQAVRGVKIFDQFLSDSGQDPDRFWPLFSRATLQQLAGAHHASANSLARALRYATREGIPRHVIATTTGFMGHAEHAGDMPDKAAVTFERLLLDPNERAHATVHLGRIVFVSHGIDAALDIWLSAPHGVAAAATAIAATADELWRQDPERSYRLVAQALGRLDRDADRFPVAQARVARARLTARARENAIVHAAR